MNWTSVIVGVAMAALPLVLSAQPDPSPPLTPFVLPWDDASAGITNVSGWLDAPAGKHGFVATAPDGHLYAGTRRIRFLGVNVCFGAAFPLHADAEKVAARMARFGINCVRFHHMDGSPTPDGLLKADGRTIDPGQLDKLDYFIAELKKHGIYTNLNLHVARSYPDMPRWGGMEHYYKGVDQFCPDMVRMQKEYARNLLTHVNPYTKTRHADEPAVAFVEINNESGLLMEYLGGRLDAMAPAVEAELARQWNDWLKRTYPQAGALEKAWSADEQPIGAEMLANGDFTPRAGTKGWTLEQHAGAAATATVANDGPQGRPAATVRVSDRGRESWHVQFGCGNLSVRKDQSYTLSFWARADKPRRLRIYVGQAHPPWDAMWSAPLPLTERWQPFTMVLAIGQDEPNARLVLGEMGGEIGSASIASVSLRPGGVTGLRAGESVGAIPFFRRATQADRTLAAQRDWIRFLYETERTYWTTMARSVRTDCGSRSVVVGTIVGCSTPGLMADLDAIDTHGYWQHPRFPGRPWDQANWTVGNVSMVNDPDGGVPGGLALRRVVGRPVLCTEYNHAAPNTFAGETPLLAAAMLALHDFDGLFLFSYSHRRDDWGPARIPNFFDIDQHPTKMANLPIAAALFTRADVAPADRLVVCTLSRDDEINLLRARCQPWSLIHAGLLGVPPAATLLHRVAIRVEGVGPPAHPPGGLSAGEVARELAGGGAGGQRVSDTGQLCWDLSTKDKGVVTVNSPRTRMVAGFVAGRSFSLGDVTIAPGATRQDWCTIAATLVKGERFAGPASILLVATGYAENTAMGWKSAAKDTVGRDWGKSPSLVEVVPATVTLPAPARRVRAWAMDATGQRAGAVAVESVGEKAALRIGPPHKTLWYEVMIE